MKLAVLAASLASIGLALVGCDGQRAYDRAADAGTARCNAMMAAPGLEAIRDRMPLSPPLNAGLVMRSDPGRPNASERAALADYQRRVEYCRATADAPSPAAIRARATNDRLLARLYAGEITFGQFNSARAQNMADLAAAEAEDWQRRDADERAQNEAEVQRAVRQSRDNMQATQRNFQQSLIKSNRQSQRFQANCSRFGNYLNCD